MKLVCERCDATYTVADEKVRGKRVTIRCRECHAIIEARGPRTARVSSDLAATVQGSARVAAAALGRGRRGSVLDRPLKSGGRRASARLADDTVEGRASARGPAPPSPRLPSRYSGDHHGRLRRAWPRDRQDRGEAGGTGSGDPALDLATQVATQDDISAALRAAAVVQVEWYLSVDGEQRGPYTKEALEEELPRFTDEELYVWREGFDDWLPPTEVTELELELRLAPPPAVGRVPQSKEVLADRVDDLARSTWSPAPTPDESAGAGTEDDEDDAPTEPPMPAPLPPLPDEPPIAAPTLEEGPDLAREAEVVPIESARERAEARARGVSESPGILGDASGGEATMGETPSARRRMPMSSVPVTDPASSGELLIAEPSQVIRVTRMRSSADSRPVSLASGLSVRHRANRLLVLAAAGGALATLSLAGVVAYLLLGRAPQVEVREVVRVRSPEEVGAAADRAAARILAEERFNKSNPPIRPPAPSAGSSKRRAASGGVSKAGGPKRPTPEKTPPPVKREGKGMASFFKAGGKQQHSVAAPDLSAVPATKRQAGRQVRDEDIVKAVRRQRGTLNVCYNRALKYDNSLKSVRLDVTIKVGASGRPIRVTIHQKVHRTSFLGTCLGDTIKRWVFPASDEDYTTQLPLVFHGQ